MADDELVELPDRSIAQLLALGTYQGMTDSELDTLIDWKVKQEVMSAQNAAIANANIAAANEIVETNRIYAEEAMDNMNKLLAGSILLREVALDE